MADLETLAAQVAELRDLEEIKKLKYATSARPTTTTKR